MPEMATHEECDELDYLGRSFLEDLLPLIKTYTIANESQFLDIVTLRANYYREDNTPSEFLLLHTNEETIYNIIQPTNHLSKHLSSIDLNHRLLLAKMSSVPHSAAAVALDHLLVKALQPMGLDLAVKGYASAEIWGHEQKRAKEPDHGWGPRRRPPGRADRPSVVLEVAYSESEAKLQSDVRFWLSPEDGNANVCLTIRIDRSKPKIRIEQWHRGEQNRIRRNQVVWIAKTTPTGPLSVTGDPLRLSFEDLFCRKPDRPGEHDLNIPAEQLEELARMVWDE